MKYFGTLFRFEMKKILCSRLTIASLLIMIVFSLVQGFFQAGSEEHGNQEMRMLRKSLDGRVLDDTLYAEMVDAADEYGVWWNETNIAYQGISQWVREIVGYGMPLAEFSEEELYAIREDDIASEMGMFQLSDSEKAYWQQRESEVQKPIVWYDTVEASGVSDCITAGTMFMWLLAGVCLSSVFAGEMRDRTDPMIRCARYGKRITYLAKIAAGTVFLLGSYLLTVGLSVCTSILFWGYNGHQGQIQILLPTSPADMNIAQVSGLVFGMALAAALLFAAVTMLLSEFLQNPVAAMAGEIGIFLLFSILSAVIPYQYRALSQIAYLLSAIDISSVLVTCEYRLIGWSGHYLSAYQFEPIFYTVISALLLLLGGVRYNRRR